MVELTERRYARPTVSRTFEGRDRFAPAAAWLAPRASTWPRSAAPPDTIHRLELAAAAASGRTASTGEVCASIASAT